MRHLQNLKHAPAKPLCQSGHLQRFRWDRAERCTDPAELSYTLHIRTAMRLQRLQAEAMSSLVTTLQRVSSKKLTAQAAGSKQRRPKLQAAGTKVTPQAATRTKAAYAVTSQLVQLHHSSMRFHINWLNTHRSCLET